MKEAVKEKGMERREKNKKWVKRREGQGKRE